ESRVEAAIRGIADLRRFAGVENQEVGVMLDEAIGKSLLESRLAGQLPVEILRGVERIVRVGDVMPQHRRIEFSRLPVLGFQSVRQPQAILADLPRQRTVPTNATGPVARERLSIRVGQTEVGEEAILIK